MDILVETSLLKNLSLSLRHLSSRQRSNFLSVLRTAAAEGYLLARKLDPENFYFAEHFKKFVNKLKPTFDDTKYDEPRIIIPLYYQEKLNWYPGQIYGF